MIDPYTVLDLGRDADEAQVRDRYLQLVREFPPDRDPERFAEIHAAYDQLRDPLVHLSRQMFEIGTRDTIDALAGDLRSRLARARLPVDALLHLAEPS